MAAGGGGGVFFHCHAVSPVRLAAGRCLFPRPPVSFDFYFFFYHSRVYVLCLNIVLPLRRYQACPRSRCLPAEFDIKRDHFYSSLETSPLFLSSAPSVRFSSCLQFPVSLTILRLKRVTQRRVSVPCEFGNCPSAESFLSSNPTSANKSLPHHHSGLF